MGTAAGDSSQGTAVTGEPCNQAHVLSRPGDRGASPETKGKLQVLLLTVSALDQPVGLLDGRLVHEDGVLGVAGLQGIVLLVLVSCNGKETR